MEVEVAVAKLGRGGAVESGDSFEMVERPRGGLSFVVANGLRPRGRAKFVSQLVARKAISLLGEGVRDDAAARATHDYLYAYGEGQATCTLNIASVIIAARTIVLARNNPAPVIAVLPGGIEVLDGPSEALGLLEETEPVMTELAVDDDVYVVVATGGFFAAGGRVGRPIDARREVADFFEIGGRGAERLADALLDRAVALDGGRPADDMTVLVVAARRRAHADPVRRLVVRAPLPGVETAGPAPEP